MNFDNVNEASGGELVKPGTKAIFTIAEVKDAKNTNEKEYFAVNFSSEDGNFTEQFYKSTGALPRLVHLWGKANPTSPLTGDVTEAQIIAGLTGKKVGLKVGGRIGTNGKTYPNLSFGGFACEPTQEALNALEFTKREKEEIEAALANLATQAADNADSETGSETASADNF